MTAQEINAARRALSSLRSEFGQVTGWARRAGQNAGREFGRRLKTAATFGIRELAKGALQGIGQRIVEGWGRTGTRSGRAFARRMKAAQKAHSASMVQSAASGFGMRLNLGAVPIIGAAALGAMAAAQVKKAIDGAFEQERITIALDALSVDGQGGKRIFGAMRADALKTGVDISAQASTIRRLMAQGMGEDEAIQLNRALLDIGGGAGLAQHEVGLLGMALAQVKGKGVAAMEELRQQIAEKGVPIFEALRQSFGMADISQVFDAISAGKISADAVIDTFANLEGPFARFLGAAERMGRTGGGLMARIRQQADDLRRVFAEGVATELKPALEYVFELMGGLKESAKQWGDELGNAIGMAKAMLESLSLAEMMQLAGLTLKRELMEAGDVLLRAVTATLSVLSSDDSFGKTLQRAALAFKSAVLLAMGEVMDVLEAAMPDTPAGQALQLAFGGASTGAKVRGRIAADDADAIARQGGKSMSDLWADVKDAFKNASSVLEFSEGDGRRVAGLLEKIQQRREADIAARGSEAPVIEHSPVGGGGGKATFDPTGMLAGNLANALSRVTGGGDIVLKKQLQTQEATLRAVEKTATATARTAEAVQELAKNTHPRNRSRQSPANLVL